MGYFKNIITVAKQLYNQYKAKGELTKTSKSVEWAEKVTKKEVKKQDKETKRIEVVEAKTETPPKPKFYLPTTERVTSSYGWRVVFNKKHFHNGLDFSSNRQFGFPVRAPESGRVIINKKSTGGGGTFVAIQGDHTKGFWYLMHSGAKNNEISNLVKKGDRVEAGQVVAYTNKTGLITGAHVHLAFYCKDWTPIDPAYVYKHFAPDVFATMKNYVDRKQLHYKNKTGKPQGTLY